jgi:hypothetical protein
MKDWFRDALMLYILGKYSVTELLLYALFVLSSVLLVPGCLLRGGFRRSKEQPVRHMARPVKISLQIVFLK